MAVRANNRCRNEKAIVGQTPSHARCRLGIFRAKATKAGRRTSAGRRNVRSLNERADLTACRRSRVCPALRQVAEEQRSRRRSDRLKCSLLVVDVDHFKKINDQHGHLAGDQVIMQIAAILKSAVRPTDIVARIGGEEFAILLIDADPCKTIEIAERVRRNVETAQAQVGGVIVPVRVSVGGVYQLMSASYEENFKVADLALYRAKRAGRNRVVFSEAEPICEFGDLTLKRA